MADYPLLSLVAAAPPGFRHCPSPAQAEVRRGIFALFAPTPEAGEAALQPYLGKITGLLVTPAPALRWERRPSGLHHAGIPPAWEGLIPDIIRPILELLALAQAQTDAKIGIERELRRAGEDRQRLVNEFAAFRESLLKEIAERRAAEEALRESEARFRVIFESVNDAIFIHDPQTGAILDVNPRTCEMYGYSRDEALRLTVGEISSGTPPYTQEDALRWMRRATQGPPRLFEWRARDKAGRLFWVEVNMRQANIGGQGRILVTLRDITARKEAEAKLRDLNLDLERRVQERTCDLESANQELEAFAYSASHDLRTPLQSIDGWGQALAEDYGDRLDKTGLGYLATIRGEAKRMRQLIDALLQLSRVARSEMSREPVDLSALATEMAATLRQHDPGRAAEIVIAPGLTARGDPVLLRTVLQNLLGNAWKFTAKTAAARIEFGQARRDDGRPAFFVRDNGAGFDRAFAAKLFLPFQRLHRQEEFAGTGIGLSLVKRIITRHGGEVWAEGEVGQGATFWFTLAE